MIRILITRRKRIRRTIIWEKNLKGKSIGRGICQRKDGIYQANLHERNSKTNLSL